MEVIATLKISVPDGWEPSSLEMRKPVPGEHFLNDSGEVCERTSQGYLPRLIVQPVWQWPDWLLANYIAMDKDGDWYAYQNQPSIHGDIWCESPNASLSLMDFTPPPCTDWTQSLRQRPGACS